MGRRDGIEIDDDDLAAIASALSQQMETYTDAVRDGTAGADVYERAHRVLAKVQAYAKRHAIQLYGRHRARNPFGYRVPTDEEIASAWRYIENEYTLKEGNVDGEQWAEGLAFGRPIGELAKVDPSWHRELMAVAREVRPQLTEDQWAMIAARADRLRADQGEVAKFKTAVKNPCHHNPSAEVFKDWKNANGLTYPEWLRQSGQRDTPVRFQAWRRGEHPRDYANQ